MSPASSPSFMRTAWFVVALLIPVALLNYLDRQMLAWSPLYPDVIMP